MWIDQRGSEVLSPAVCYRLLAIGGKERMVGRRAVGGDQAPVVLPINFVVHDHSVLIRIGIGSLSQGALDHLVAFEVDEVDEVEGLAWSVLVRGLATVLDPDDADLIVGLPTPLVPNPGAIVLSIRPDVVTGRRFPLLIVE